MPADTPETPQGYLRGILVDGNKPFPYRSGIRTLLGLPDDPGARIVYPLPLPPAGFQYLGVSSFGEVEVGPSLFVDETERPLAGHGSPPGMEPFGWPQTSRGSDPDALPNPVTPRGAGRSRRESPPPAARREESPPESGNARAGEQSIDIPGFSQKAIRFPALELHESGESPDAPTRPIREEVQTPVSRGEASIERREIRRESTFVEAPDLARAAARRATERVDHVPAVPRDLGKHVPSETMTPDHVRPEPDIESLPVFRGPARDLAARDLTVRDLTARDLMMMPASTPRSGTEAPIGPGRQVASPVTRRAEGPETPPQDIDFATRAPNRPDPPPQVVVVNRAHPYPPSRTPAAFWERSYLGHLFRLRRLR